MTDAEIAAEADRRGFLTPRQALDPDSEYELGWTEAIQRHEAEQQREQGPTRFRATLLRRSELRNLPPIEPLIDGVLSRRVAAVLVGPTGAGKTFVALSWACSVATGHNWLGRRVERCPALYVVGEGAHGLDPRITAWEQTWGVPVEDDDLIVSVKPESLVESRVWAEMRVEALDLGCGFVVLDTFSSLAPNADETKDAALITRRLSDLAAGIDGTALLVHHPGWSDSDRVRGGYQLEANVDEVLLLRGNAQSDLIELERKKVKEGPAGEKTWLRRREMHGSVVIEATSDVEKVAQVVGKAEQVARVVFGADEFSGAQLRDALIERLSVSKTTAYEHIRDLVKDGGIYRVGGTDRYPRYRVADAD